MTDGPTPRVCTPRPRRGTHPAFPLGAHVRVPDFLAMEPGERWPAGSVLTYALGSGPAALQDEFRRAVATVAPHVNLAFRELRPGEDAATRAVIRVAFRPDGSSWSDVGRDCLLVPRDEPTMNLGWPDDLGRSIHELLHALGFMHNQSIPNHELHLDRAKCYAFFGGPPNNWDRATVDSQVLYIFTGAFVGSGFDRDSIMQYAVPDALTTDGRGIPWNQTLSAGDVADLHALYPRAGSPTAPVAPSPPTPTPTPPPVVAPVTTTPKPAGTTVGTTLELITRALALVQSYVDLARLEEVVLAAEMQAPGLESAVAAVKANEAAIFKTALGRFGADEVLSLLIAASKHGA